MNIRVLAARTAYVAAALAVLAALATPAIAARSHRSGASVTVVATEFKFKLTPTAVAAPGSVTFTVINKGKLAHDFQIGGKKTPLISPGQKAKLTVVLKKGKYPYKCTVPGHAAAGMLGTLIVK